MQAKFVLVLAAVAAAISFSLSANNGKDENFKVLELHEEHIGLIPIDGAAGPESIEFDANGEGPYTGVCDGRILKWDGKQRRWIDYASSSPLELLGKCRGSQDPRKEHECGRPLGLKFNKKTGDLYIADSYLGLLVVRSGENFTRTVATQAQGIPFRFTNSLDIDGDTGVVYFTDSSTRFQRREFMSSVISGDQTGRLMKYDPKNNEIEVLLDFLSFPNGLALSEDGSFLLIAETNNCRVLKYWLKSPKASAFDVVAELPGFPDNIKRNPRGGFWVALHSKRGKIVNWAFSCPWLRRALLKLPLNQIQRVSSLLNRIGRQVLALRLSEDGEVLEVLQGNVGRKVRSVSEVEERNGSLWIGSVVLPYLGVHHR